MPNQKEIQTHQVPTLKNILIVDDDKDNIEILNLFLNHLGYFNIEHCFNGKDAYEMLISHHFDLVFLDVRMPVWDGYFTLKKLNLYKLSNPFFKTTIIVLSANSFQEDIEKSKAKGADYHISKPISIQKIQNIMSNSFE